MDGDTLKSAPQLPMPARPIPPSGYGDYETGYFSTDMQVQEMVNICLASSLSVCVCVRSFSYWFYISSI